MKKMLFLFCLLLSLGCEKAPEDPGRTVKYEVIAQSSTALDYAINYLISDGSEFEVGTFTSPAWVSNPVPGFEPGDLVRLTVNNKGGSTNFTLRVKVNGILLAEEDKTLNTGTFSLEEYIPVF